MADVSNRMRGFILDSQVQSAHTISTLLGLPVISDEVAEREEEESDLRVDRVSYLMPLLYAHARTMAEGSVALQKGSATELVSQVPDEVWAASRHLLEEITMSVLMGSISQLVDMGLLEIPKKIRKK